VLIGSVSTAVSAWNFMDRRSVQMAACCCFGNWTEVLGLHDLAGEHLIDSDRPAKGLYRDDGLASYAAKAA
jgi:hypothetical protein